MSLLGYFLLFNLLAFGRFSCFLHNLLRLGFLVVVTALRIAALGVGAVARGAGVFLALLSLRLCELLSLLLALLFELLLLESELFNASKSLILLFVDELDVFEFIFNVSLLALDKFLEELYVLLVL